jgi:hypothetical protein
MLLAQMWVFTFSPSRFCCRCSARRSTRHKLDTAFRSCKFTARVYFAPPIARTCGERTGQGQWKVLITVAAISTLSGRPTGTSRAYALRRLREQRPDIHARVLAGEISPHAGMVEAGFRKRPGRDRRS